MKRTILILGIAGFLSAAPQETPKGLTRDATATRPQKGASFTEDMKAENLRHQDRLTDLNERAGTIHTELRNAMIRCRGEQSCRQRAIEEYRRKIDDLQIDRNNEDNQHEINRQEIIRSWRDNSGAFPAAGATPGLPAPAIARNPPTRYENGGIVMQLQTGEWVPAFKDGDGWRVLWKGQWVKANQ
jgi:hypothetical protein